LDLKIISAGAGSGKTYRLTNDMFQLLSSGLRASGIIATTFTSKAAAELQERVRTKLLQEGLTEQANDLTNALIGTVHGLGVKLLKRFAFEAGVSPKVEIIADEDSQYLFNQSLSQVLTMDKIEKMNELCDRLGIVGPMATTFDWRKEIKQVVEVARANNFSRKTMEESKIFSYNSFEKYLGKTSPVDLKVWLVDPKDHLKTTIENLENGTDSTKVTSEACAELKGFYNELRLREHIRWHQCIKIAKIKVGAKSKEIVEELQDYAKTHTALTNFRKDIQEYIALIFDISTDAIAEYDLFKKNRGLIDYTDMETYINKLMDNPQVQEVLKEELDLLMVDEFQDTSPLQLEIFLKMSKIAKKAIWVGDPKQSIYGFRGAEPRLMQAIIQHVGIQPENILSDSWRSRPDIVNATNAIFTKSFHNLPKEQVALNPKRKNAADQRLSLQHWYFNLTEEKKKPTKGWMANCIATEVAKILDRNYLILPKGEEKPRKAEAGDIAVLCKTNFGCQAIAESLHNAGLKAAISRMGLLQTPEAKLILACLRYMLNRHDSLSVAEILLLAQRLPLSEIIEDRLSFLDRTADDPYDWKWAYEQPIIKQLNDLRREAIELSSVEVLNLVLEETDLRRTITAYGNQAQRLANIDMMRKYVGQYEDSCTRLHTAASLGGCLLWLNNLERATRDSQSSGEGFDAVNVLTYHRSKGLEYPIVIIADLDADLKDSLWGISVVSTQEKVDLDNILGNRLLRYWVNPYGLQIKNTDLEEAINQGEEKKATTQAAKDEEARLLYVGITRARDYLFFPTAKGQTTKWLNRAWHNGNEDNPVLEEGDDTCFEWNGEYLQKEFLEEHYPLQFAWSSTTNGQASNQVQQPQAPEIRAGKQIHSPYIIDAQKETMSGEFNYRLSEPHTYHSPFDKHADPITSKAYQTLLNAVINDNQVINTKDATDLVIQIIQRYGIQIAPTPDNWVTMAQAYQSFLNKYFEIKHQTPKYPIRHHYLDRLFQGTIDLMIETKQGEYILIQNSAYNGDIKKSRTEANTLALTLNLSRDALQKATNKKVKCFVHFYIQGNLIEII
jgi:ATP-dependent helicase/nuclease subunit A